MKLLTPEWVSPPFDSSVEFLIRGMNGLEWYDFLHSGDVRQTGKRATVSRRSAEIALQAVLDWKGVEDNNGPVKFSPDKWEMVESRYVDWALGEVIARSHKTEEQEKN